MIIWTLEKFMRWGFWFFTFECYAFFTWFWSRWWRSFRFKWISRLEKITKGFWKWTYKESLALVLFVLYTKWRSWFKKFFRMTSCNACINCSIRFLTLLQIIIEFWSLNKMTHGVSFYRPQFRQRLSHKIWSLETFLLSLPQSLIDLTEIFNQLLWGNILRRLHIVRNASSLVCWGFQMFWLLQMLTLICSNLTIIRSQCFNRSIIVWNLLSRVHWVTHFSRLLKLDWKGANNRL